MRKRDRHQLIKKMITEEKLSTQKEIQDRLEAHNVFVTQTTLSRDLREIGLTKVKKNDMVYYVLANETDKIDLVEFLSHHLEGVARAEFTLVLHTKLGEAAVLANIVDANKDEWILGTVAGANSLLVICRDQHVAKLMEDRLLDYRQEFMTGLDCPTASQLCMIGYFNGCLCIHLMWIMSIIKIAKFYRNDWFVKGNPLIY